MRTRCLVLLFAVLLGSTRWLAASGPIGIYGIVERVVFEPNEAQAERVQVWGAFSYVDGGAGNPLGVSSAAKGYLYFRLPTAADGRLGPEEVQLVRREWADLKAVAGTGQAVGFGSWGYIGGFGGLNPAATSANPPYVIERAPRGGTQSHLRVRPATETAGSPSIYQINAGVVKLPDTGSQAEVVRQLREALRGNAKVHSR